VNVASFHKNSLVAMHFITSPTFVLVVWDSNADRSWRLPSYINPLGCFVYTIYLCFGMDAHFGFYSNAIYLFA